MAKKSSKMVEIITLDRKPLRNNLRVCLNGGLYFTTPIGLLGFCFCFNICFVSIFLDIPYNFGEITKIMFFWKTLE